jgi:hypothetical protein
MIRAILKARFTVPGHVSSACRELIVAMLRSAPGDRIPVESILEHPWLKLAKLGVRKGGLAGAAPALPPLRSASIEDLGAMASGMAVAKDATGIVSPFDDDGSVIEMDLEEGRPGSARMPPNVLAVGRQKGPGATGMSLSQNRQRSAKNMLMKPALLVKPGLDVIHE